MYETDLKPASRRKQEIRGFDIAMHDTQLTMQVVQAHKHLRRQNRW